MAEKSLVYDELNRHWKSACRILFGDEIGELSEYKEWLMHANEPILHTRSSVSGKEVTFAISDYCETSKRISLDEVDFEKKFQPLSINEIKDIDSIVEAVRERSYYCGNLILGNSGFVERSSSITDSFYIYESAKFGNSKCIAYSTLGRLCEYIFGSNGVGESSWCISCYETYKDNRCFELWKSENCSDCYYCFDLGDCRECLFTFNAKGKSYAIGNLELAREKYMQMKKKLLEEMREKLERNKELPLLTEIVSKCDDYSGELRELLKGKLKEVEEKKDKGKIEEAFAKTTGVIFGRALLGIDEYGKWLEERTISARRGCSALSKAPILVRDYSGFFQLPKGRLATYGEGQMIGESVKITQGETEKLTLANAHEIIGRAAYFSPEYVQGKNVNNIECPTQNYAMHCYRASPVIHSKYCAYTFWPRHCEYIFGSESIWDSTFCINCYYSSAIKRCFEVDEGKECADSYFCHNVENVQNGMFCFNVKNKSYAIGNAQIGKEEYISLKKKLLLEMAGELEGKGRLKWDIYSVGCKV